MDSLIDLRPEHLRIVERLLREYVPDREVRAFGSRVAGKAKPTSDLDLCVMGSTSLAASDIDALDLAFSESTLPFKVDVVEWVRLSARFQQLILQPSVVIQLGKSRHP
jgi:type I restriction enzyme S subunit